MQEGIFLENLSKYCHTRFRSSQNPGLKHNFLDNEIEWAYHMTIIAIVPLKQSYYLRMIF